MAGDKALNPTWTPRPTAAKRIENFRLFVFIAEEPTEYGQNAAVRVYDDGTALIEGGR